MPMVVRVGIGISGLAMETINMVKITVEIVEERQLVQIIPYRSIVHAPVFTLLRDNYVEDILL